MKANQEDRNILEDDPLDGKIGDIADGLGQGKWLLHILLL